MRPLSKAKLKLFTALQQKKYRHQNRLFLAEGVKLLQEALKSSFELEAVVVREGNSTPALAGISAESLFVATPADFLKLSTQVHSEGVIAIVKIPPPPHFQAINQLTDPVSAPTLVLEDLRDPGNLGTLIRTADWFGFHHLICSHGTVDVYNPKVVRAAMGSLFRVHITYLKDFHGFLREQAAAIWAADMEGADLGQVQLHSKPMILMGNEANGVSETTRSIPGLEKVTIPKVGDAESLNVGIAAGILTAAWNMQTPKP